MSQSPNDYPTSSLRQDEPLIVGDADAVTMEAQLYPAAPAVAYPTDDRDQSSSTAEVAKDQAAQVKDTATDASKHVAGVAKDQAGQVASEAKAQTRDLIDQGRRELSDQAAAQQDRVATGLRSVQQELHSMASASTENGIGADLARQAADQAGKVAGWMEGRDPGDLLDEVRSFARQRPAAFLGIAAAAGVLAGRMGRGIKAGPTEPEVATPAHRAAPDSTLEVGGGF